MVNKNTTKIVVAVLAVIVVIAVAYFYMFVKQSSEYSIVYLSTGEVYVGHLSTFPRLTLTDGYVFQAVPDPADPKKSTFQLSPLKEALWAPQYLYINKDHVLFSGPLTETSNILQTLRNPAGNNLPANNPAPATSTGA